MIDDRGLYFATQSFTETRTLFVTSLFLALYFFLSLLFFFFFFWYADLHNVRVKIALVSLAEHKWIALDDIGLKFKVAIEARANTRDRPGACYAPCAAAALCEKRCEVIKSR